MVCFHTFHAKGDQERLKWLRESLHGQREFQRVLGFRTLVVMRFELLGKHYNLCETLCFQTLEML